MPSRNSADDSLVYVGHRLFDGRSAAVNAEIHSIIAAEGGQSNADVRVPRAPEIRTLEDSGWVRRHWSSDDLDTICTELLSDSSVASSSPILPYAACSSLNAGEGRLGPPVFAARLTLRRYLDNKVAARHLFSSLRLPEPHWTAAIPTKAAVAAVAESIGYPFVARAPFSNAGAGTFLIRGEDDAQQLIQQIGYEHVLKWLFEQYLPGVSLNVNAIASQRRIDVYVPSVQILGEATGRATPFAFCGNDYAAAQELPSAVLLAVTEQTKEIAKRVSAMGFRGIFGVDFVIDEEGCPFPCEINPRFQHSTALLNWSLCEEPEFSPVQRHLQSFTGQGPDAERPTPPPTALYSQISVHSDLRGHAEAANGLSEGLYTFDQGNLRLVDTRCDPRLVTPDSFLAADTVRAAGTVVHQGASLARLIFSGSILDPASLRLRASMSPIIESVRSALNLRSRLAEVG